MSVQPLAPVAPLWIDHVVMAVEDLGATAKRLAAEHGLGSYTAHPPGGLPGLVGRIVPCGSGYLHLLAVEDDACAAAHLLGAAVLGALGTGRSLLSWAVATDDIDAFLGRTGCHAVVEEIAGSNGTRLGRRVVGAELALTGAVPAIVCWDEDQGHPERQQVEHRVDPVGITSVSLGADLGVLGWWLGAAVHDLPVKLLPGCQGLRAVTVATSIADMVVANRDGDAAPGWNHGGRGTISTGLLPVCDRGVGSLDP